MNMYPDHIDVKLTDADVQSLRYMVKLETLSLSGHGEISDISFLAGLTNLKGLGLGSNNISDISVLAGLTNLESLGIYDNQISDVSPLFGLTNLRGIRLTPNPLTTEKIEELQAALPNTHIYGADWLE